jgi:hypothetical protein
MNDNAIRPDRIGHEGEEMFIREPAAVCVALMQGKERVDRCRQLFLHERYPASFYGAVSRLSELHLAAAPASPVSTPALPPLEAQSSAARLLPRTSQPDPAA